MAMISVAGLSRFLENLRSIFVAKDGNKVLSDNNFTDVDYDKLDGIAYNADASKITAVKVNGVALPIITKSVDIPIPDVSNFLETDDVVEVTDTEIDNLFNT